MIKPLHSSCDGSANKRRAVDFPVLTRRKSVRAGDIQLGYVPAVIGHYSPIPKVSVERSAAKGLVTVELPMGKALPCLSPFININGLNHFSLHDTQIVPNNVVT